MYAKSPVTNERIALAVSVRLNEILLQELYRMDTRPRDEIYREALTIFSAALRRFVETQVTMATLPGEQAVERLNEAATILITARRELDQAHVDVVNERVTTAYSGQLDTLAFIDQVQALAQAVGDMAVEVAKTRNQVLGKLDLIERAVGNGDTTN